jgi:hypothetical protein
MAEDIINDFRILLRQLDNTQHTIDFYKQAIKDNPSEHRQSGNNAAYDSVIKDNERKSSDNFEKLREIIIKEYNGGNPTNTWKAIENEIINTDAAKGASKLIFGIMEMKIQASDYSNLKPLLKATLANGAQKSFEIMTGDLFWKKTGEKFQKIPECLEALESICMETEDPKWLSWIANSKFVDPELIGQCFAKLPLKDNEKDYLESFGQNFAKELSPETRELLKTKYDELTNVKVNEDMERF